MNNYGKCQLRRKEVHMIDAEIRSHADLTDWYNTELIQFHFQIIIFLSVPAVMMENDSQISDKDIYIETKSNAPESLTVFANVPSADT